MYLSCFVIKAGFLIRKPVLCIAGSTIEICIPCGSGIIVYLLKTISSKTQDANTYIPPPHLQQCPIYSNLEN